jgi:hypothetical protein
LESLIDAIRNMNWTEFMWAFTVCAHWSVIPIAEIDTRVVVLSE